jgi:hypothetical protein
MLFPLLSTVKLAPARELHVYLVINKTYGMSSDHKLVPTLNFLTCALAFNPAKQSQFTLYPWLYKPKFRFKPHSRTLPNFGPRPPQTRHPLLSVVIRLEFGSMLQRKEKSA